MASMKFGKDTVLWQMFTDYWSMCQRVWIREDNPDYWKQVVDETSTFAGKYKDYRFAARLATALVDELYAAEKEEREL